MTTTAEAPAARSPANSTPKRYFAHIPTREISDFPFNYRMDFNTLAIAELSESIQKQGLIEPIIVLRQEGADRVGTVNGKVENWKHRYIGIAGERRWRAVQLAEMDEIPAIVYEGLTDQQALEIALVENLQRQDVNPIEEANGYRMLKERAHLKQNQIAERVGRPRSTVANTMRLLDLPQSVQDHISKGTLTKAHGIALLRFRGYDQVIEFIARKCVENDVPAGSIEKGLPYDYELAQADLVHCWDHFSINAQWYPVEAAVIAKCREEDKEVGWIEDPINGDICVLDLKRGEQVETLIAAAKEKAHKQARAKAEKEASENEVNEPDETPEQREGRLKREKEEQERQAQFEAAKERAGKWWGWQSFKGPTGGSMMKDWDPILKAFLLIHDFFDYVDVDEELLAEYLPPGTVIDDKEDEAIVEMLFKVPAHQLIELIIRDQIRHYSNGSTWGLNRLTEIMDLLEGKREASNG
jgi:ParB/RepB/Spo0J family partition protein